MFYVVLFVMNFFKTILHNKLRIETIYDSIEKFAKGNYKYEDIENCS